MLCEIGCFEMLAMVRFPWALLSKPGGDSGIFLTSVVWEEIIACLLKLPLGFFREQATAQLCRHPGRCHSGLSLAKNEPV